MTLRILVVSCWILALLATASAQPARRKAQVPQTHKTEQTQAPIAPGGKANTPVLRQNQPIGWVWVTQTIDLAQQFGNEENIFTLDGEPPPSLLQKRISLGLVINDQGYVITRLIDVTPSNPPNDLTVRASGGRPTKARFIGMDTVTGFCVVKVDGEALRQANFANQSSLPPRLNIKLYGFHPNQEVNPERVSMTVTPRLNSFTGLISIAAGDFRFTAKNPIYFLTSPKLTAVQDCSLIFKDESVFGIALYDTGLEGKHIVYPISRVRAIAESVIKSNQSIAYGWLGANGQNFAPPIQTPTSNRKPGEPGIIITAIAPDSPADLAGVMPKDILLSINDRRVETREQLATAIRQIPADSEVSLRVRRGGEYKMLKAKLAPAPATEPEQQLFAFVRRLEAMKAELKSISASDPKRQNLEARFNMMTNFVQAVTSPAPPDIRLRVIYGFEVESLTGQLMNYFAVTNGLLVSNVANKNKAASAGLQAGDVIVKVGEQQINNLPSLVNALDNSKDETIEVTVSRRRELMKISLPH
ncbi:MAG: PDZ domain-containing protein [Blastocatellia bacterium]